MFSGKLFAVLLAVAAVGVTGSPIRLVPEARFLGINSDVARSPARPAPEARFWGINSDVARSPARPAHERRSPTELGAEYDNVARSPYVIIIKDANPKSPTEL